MFCHFNPKLVIYSERAVTLRAKPNFNLTQANPAYVYKKAFKQIWHVSTDGTFDITQIGVEVGGVLFGKRYNATANFQQGCILGC